jgi:Copper binding proteins, plastocyanin/azurin family
VAEPTDSYSAPTYNADQGSLVPFQNNGGSHNVTARQKGPDGNDLFRSETTTSGTTPVNGTQYLTTGAYPFFCTVHPTTMQGTLQVTGAGTPQARPSATLAVKGKSLAKAIKKGIKLTATASTRTDAEFTARLGKTLIGQKRVSLATGAQSVLVKLSKAGKSKLRAKGKATVKVTAEIPFGSPVTAKAKLK